MFLTVGGYEGIAGMVHGVGVGHIVIGSDSVAGGMTVGVVVEVGHHFWMDSTGTQERKLGENWGKTMVGLSGPLVKAIAYVHELGDLLVNLEVEIKSFA